MNHRVANALARLKKGDLVLIEWEDPQASRLEWDEMDDADLALVKTVSFVHSYDGKKLVLYVDEDPIGGRDATPTVLPMGPFTNVVQSCLRITKHGWVEIWDISGGKQKEQADE